MPFRISETPAAVTPAAGAPAGHDAFAGVPGQAEACAYLRRVAQEGRASHAYLLAGPAGSGKAAAAFAFASALLCNDGGCGRCDTCLRVLRRVHPDVHWLSPEGAQGYLAAQIREVIADALLAPIAAAKKVYIIDRADLMNASAANSFLKTLEEPSADVVFILLAPTAAAVLPTVASRCQTVALRHIPASEAAEIVMEGAAAKGCPCARETAAYALAACGGSTADAIAFACDPQSLELRRVAVEGLARLAQGDAADALVLSKQLVAACKAPLDDVRAQLEEQLEEQGDFLSKAALKQVEAGNKRLLSAKGTAALRQVGSIVQSWLRDVLLHRSGCPQLAVNADCAAALQECAQRASYGAIVQAVDAVRAYDAAIAYNVSPQACMDVLLLKIRSLLRASGPR